VVFSDSKYVEPDLIGALYAFQQVGHSLHVFVGVAGRSAKVGGGKTVNAYFHVVVSWFCVEIK
jgi:hypothetical protein